jgi:hypothetical protein
LIVVDFLEIEIHRIGPRRFGVGGHLEFVGIRRLELRANKRWRQSSEQPELLRTGREISA